VSAYASAGLARFLADSRCDTPGRPLQVETWPRRSCRNCSRRQRAVDMGEPFLQQQTSHHRCRSGRRLAHGRISKRDGKNPLALRAGGDGQSPSSVIPVAARLNTLIRAPWVALLEVDPAIPRPRPMSISVPVAGG